MRADRHLLADLLLCLRRAEREYRDAPLAGLLDDADRLFDRNLLVRADREAELGRFDVETVFGDGELAMLPTDEARRDPQAAIGTAADDCVLLQDNPLDVRLLMGDFQPDLHGRTAV